MRTQRCGSGAWGTLISLLAGFTFGCYSMSGGFWPPVEHLDELRPGISSAADVENLLGTPLGHGRARFTPDSVSRDIWVYAKAGYSGTGFSFDEARLIVLFEDGRYDGYYFTILGRLPEPSTGPGR